MKTYIRIYTLLLIVSFAIACQHEESVAIDTDEFICFSLPQISVEESDSFLTRSTFLEESLPEGASFGVMSYCIPYRQGSMEKDWSSGSYGWSQIKSNAFPDVLYNQKVICQGAACIYEYNSGGPRRWYNEKDDPESINPENYQYAFFAWYPYDGFKLESPTTATEKGAPKLTFTMPFDEGKETTSLDDSKTPDAMLSAVFNHQKNEGPVQLTFSHMLVGLGFAITNYHETEDIKVNSVTLSGAFVRSVTVDFNKDASDPSSYKYSGRYKGIYTYSDTPLVLTPSEKVPLVGGKHLLLLSDATGAYFGETNVTVNYTFRGETRVFKTGRPGAFMPRTGTRYTANLNFISESFVINFESDELWEDGNENDDDLITQ